ncbi:protein-disulfide reductase DsbD [Alkalilimnicola sp. S0819]|uniref:protein-disulfide reductase DsbD n=1 Tax=Alkalilimnicola sp. S0819 TaxID=2613922 RepID=UPI0012622B21|nr:protein-disulfide reductase DsbD [Alkalilimnicola sp. S0819]KAB7623415.1 protein-disulfide reductase DsbD [Alkalilimnicola sp. S0819]MPQ16961.1 protein-disulfide reductase DsbD [Alkalilimnicola sp. S0819]
MKHILTKLCLLVLLAVPAIATAQDFLPPDQAFRLEVDAVSAESVTLHWEVAPGYYLYREQIAVAAPGSSAVQLGAPKLPGGVVKEDPYFGRTELYYDSLTATVPLSAPDGLPERLDLAVRHQGCAEDGICYPPQTTTLSVDLAAAGLAGGVVNGGPGGASGGSSGEGSASNAVSTAEMPEQDRLAAMLAGEHLYWVLLAFFGAGLLLSFSPCMLPMLPILSGIIVGTGGKAGGSRHRGLMLSLAYVLPMALAYAGLGTLAGLAGANLQASLQSPWLLVPFAGLFVLLAMAMFGFYELRLPAGLQSRLSEASNRLPGGQLLGVAAMGLLSALIVGPCMTAPLAGALLYIGQSGHAMVGGLALFSLGLGMGLPLIVMGTVGGRVLPKAGPWMRGLQAFFGFVLLGVAIWMLERVIPPAVTVALWGLLLVALAVVLGALEPLPEAAGPTRRFGKVLGLAAGIWSATLLVGAAAGAQDPLRPLAFLAERGGAASEAVAVDHVPLEGLAAVSSQLARARAVGQPVVVDFYADWCVSCKIMEKTVFGDPRVARAMEGVLRLRPDVTANNADDRALQAHYQVPGPPTLMFFGADGEERRALRVVGEIGADTFLQKLDAAKGNS